MYFVVDDADDLHTMVLDLRKDIRHISVYVHAVSEDIRMHMTVRYRSLVSMNRQDTQV